MKGRRSRSSSSGTSSSDGICAGAFPKLGDPNIDLKTSQSFMLDRVLP